MNTDTLKILQSFENARSDRNGKLEQFLSGKRPYLIVQFPDAKIWGDIRTPEQCFEENISHVKNSLETPSDHLPVLEPWFGVGVYANMYGCDYVWREGEAPAVHYKYHKLEEVQGVRKPRWQDSPIATLVLDTIRYFKRLTGEAIPIVWTDTQSASDTATLILDACEVLASCLTAPAEVMQFMQGINELIIEFSIIQSELIGGASIYPGHNFFSHSSLSGLSVSDDNISVVYPRVNRQFNLPLDQAIGQALGGIAIHSCGKWAQTMKLLKEYVPSCRGIDCALDQDVDPSPNEPEQVREAMKGSGIWLQVRMTGHTERMLETVKRLLDPSLKLVVRPAYIDLPTAERNYAELESLLGNFYKTK